MALSIQHGIGVKIDKSMKRKRVSRNRPTEIWTTYTYEVTKVIQWRKLFKKNLEQLDIHRQKSKNKKFDSYLTSPKNKF